VGDARQRIEKAGIVSVSQPKRNIDVFSLGKEAGIKSLYFYKGISKEHGRCAAYAKNLNELPRECIHRVMFAQAEANTKMGEPDAGRLDNPMWRENQ
jgi:hypothetical protein